MMSNLSLSMNLADWLSLFSHFLSLSLLAIGGAITIVPDLHRFLVTEQHWLTDSQFTASIALAQAAPGPNVLYIALLGWHVGINSAGVAATLPLVWAKGLLGAAVAMTGILLPSTTLAYTAARWMHGHRELRSVRAFKQGMAPIVIALLLCTGWILLANQVGAASDMRVWVLTAVVTVIAMWTRVSILWLLLGGAVLGGLGLV